MSKNLKDISCFVFFVKDYDRFCGEAADCTNGSFSVSEPECLCNVYILSLDYKCFFPSMKGAVVLEVLQSFT